MRKLKSRPAPVFIQAIKNGLSFWLIKTKELDADSIKYFDPLRGNLFQIIDLGLQVPELWELTAELMVQVFPLSERRGYWNLWLEKLALAIANAPKIPTDTLVRLQINYGKLQRSLGQQENALESHNIAMHLAHQLENTALVAQASMELGWDYLFQNDLESARMAGEKALDLFKKNDQIKPDAQFVDSLRLLGLYEIRRGNAHQAVEILKKALKNAQIIKSPIVLARTYMDLGGAYRRIQNISEAMDCFTKATELLQNTTYEGDKISVLLNIGALYFDQANWKSAETSFMKVNRRYLQESGNLTTQAMLLNNLGNVYLKQNRLEEADNFLQDALALWSKTGDEIEWANTQSTLAAVFVKQARMEEAKPLILKAMEKIEKYPNHAWANEIKSELEELHEQVK